MSHADLELGLNTTATAPLESTEPLTPGLLVIHGNRPESLRDLLVQWLQRYPLAPLENEVLLVQSNGIAQWLQLALAQPVHAGGMGIAAAVDAQLPSRFIWQAYRAVLGAAHVPERSPLDREALVWRLMQGLPTWSQQDGFEPLRRFLEAEDETSSADTPDDLALSKARRCMQLSLQLSDLYDQYQVYRADWLRAWRSEHDVITWADARPTQPLAPEDRWQAALWRELWRDVGSSADTSRAAVHQLFLDRVAAWGDAAPPAGLPRRLVVFGLSSLPQQSLEVIGALARWLQVIVLLHNPCEHDWSQIVPSRWFLRWSSPRHRQRDGMPKAIADEDLHRYAHPLLAAWGQQGRDFIALLDRYDEPETTARRMSAVTQRIDLYEAIEGRNLLEQLQDDIRDLRPLAETQSRWPAFDPARDASIRFHITHSALREVEVLHDRLLAAFDEMPGLMPRDVLVMVPDIDAYAPFIRAVFGSHARKDGHEDARAIPFSLSDHRSSLHDPLMSTLRQLLDLPRSRLLVSDVLDWLEVPALQHRFGWEAADVPLLQRWIAAANIRWGLDGEQRERLGLPAMAGQNTWVFGLHRCMLGYISGDGPAWAEVEPLPEIAGLDALLLGRLATLIDALQTTLTALSTPASPEVWVVRLSGLLTQFFAPSTARDRATIHRLQQLLLDWQSLCASCQFQEALPLPLVSEHWLAGLDEGGLGQSFFAGAVTFATLMPMRAIPFRFVALLGMNDRDYPRQRVPMDFDLMAKAPRPGDRARREDDRYLFLEAVLSAREVLHISWVGRSIIDQSVLPPSVLVAQLRDHLASAWRLQGQPELNPAVMGADTTSGQALLSALTVEHRVAPFDPIYFQEQGGARSSTYYSYAQEWAPAPVPNPRERALELLPPLSAHGASNATAEPLVWSLASVTQLLRQPVDFFYQRRLHVIWRDAPEPALDAETVKLDGLDLWAHRSALIQAVVGAHRRNGQWSFEKVATTYFLRQRRQGVLAPGAFGELQQERILQGLSELFEQYQALIGALPQTLEPWLLRATGKSPQPWSFADTIDELRAESASSSPTRVRLSVSNLVSSDSGRGKWRHTALLPYWVEHVAGNCERALTTRVLSPVGDVTFAPITQADAKNQWQSWMHIGAWAWRRPLPLAPKTALAFLMNSASAASAPQGGKPNTKTKPPSVAPLEAARREYEPVSDYALGEVTSSPYLEATFPNFAALMAASAALANEPATFESLAPAMYGCLLTALTASTSESTETSS